MLMTAMLAALTLSGGPPQSWKIVIDRPVEKGFSYHLKANGEMAVTMKSADGKMLKETILTAKISAGVTVSKVDSRGVPLELTLVVNTLDIVSNGKASRPLENEIVTAKRDGPSETFVASFGEIMGDARKALRLLVSVQPEGAPRIDEAFPMGGPRKLGDSWPIDGAQMAAAMLKHGSIAAPESVKGMAKLNGVVSCNDGATCFDIGFEFTVADVRPADKPRGMTWLGGNAKTVMTGILPLDPKKPRTSETQEDWMTARVVVDRENRTIEYHRKVTRNLKLTR